MIIYHLYSQSSYMHVLTWWSVSQLCSITFILGFIPSCLYWFSITLDQIPASKDVNRICCEQKNGLNNIVQEKRNKQHQELRSLFALEVKQIITTPSTLHYPTPSCHFLPSQFKKICDISKPSYAVTFSGVFQEIHIYDLLTTYKIQSTCTIGVFLLYSNKMQ